jgi:Arc/MetJ family transcription regulator
MEAVQGPQGIETGAGPDTTRLSGRTPALLLLLASTADWTHGPILSAPRTARTIAASSIIGPLRIWHAICHTAGMRTTLDIDDDLLAALLDRYPGRSKTEAIEAALRAYLAEDAVSRLRRLAGTLDIEDVSATSRAHDRRS